MALTDNIVAYWKFDESSGNASDSVGSNTLTNTGTCSYSAGRINNGVNTVNTSKFMECAHNAAFNFGTGGFSVSIWFKLADTSLNATENVVRHYSGGGWVIQFKSASRNVAFYATTTGPAQSSSNSIPNDTNLHHLVCTRDGATAAIYVDGSDVTASATVGSGSVDVSTGFYVGTNGASEGFDGLVDELGLWSRALSSTEVTSLYNGGNGIQYPFSSSAIKSIYGLAKASVKSVDGLAIASVKNIKGLV